MRSDEQYLRTMKDDKLHLERALYQESVREVALYLEYLRREDVMPSTRYFSLTKMRVIPLWTVYGYRGMDENELICISSTGKLYQLRGLGWMAPASRYEKVHIGATLRRMREKREEAVRQIDSSGRKKPRSIFRVAKKS